MKGSSYHSSKGNQIKWKENGYWYKLEYLGYESLAEFIVSKLLKKSNVENYVIYELKKIMYRGQEQVGCVSKDFLEVDEELITIERLIQHHKGESLTNLMIGKTLEEKISLLVDLVEEITGIHDFGKYITLLLEIDCFFLNEDRHTHNIAVIRCGNGTFRLCPIFDNGASLFSDMRQDYLMNMEIEECYEKIVSKPFSRSFDEQMDEAELLYGRQLKLGLVAKDITEVLQEAAVYYDNEVITRVETILRYQYRKYKYLI